MINIPYIVQFEEKYTVTTFLSFFNLGVDLLLEGLDGATECEEYLFHFERGYGTEYFTDVSEWNACCAAFCVTF